MSGCLGANPTSCPARLPGVATSRNPSLFLSHKTGLGNDLPHRNDLPHGTVSELGGGVCPPRRQHIMHKTTRDSVRRPRVGVSFPFV